MLPNRHDNVEQAAFWQHALTPRARVWHGEQCVGRLTAIHSRVDVRFHRRIDTVQSSKRHLAQEHRLLRLRPTGTNPHDSCFSRLHFSQHRTRPFGALSIVERDIAELPTVNHALEAVPDSGHRLGLAEHSCADLPQMQPQDERRGVPLIHIELRLPPRIVEVDFGDHSIEAIRLAGETKHHCARQMHVAIQHAEPKRRTQFCDALIFTFRISLLIAESNIMTAAKVADKLYVIDRGEIIFQGEPREVFDNEEVMKTIRG